jgi:hypothetical protein
MKKEPGIIFIVVCVVLCLSAGTVLAGETCKRVNIAHGGLPVYFFDPEDCNGYDGCGSWEVHGTPNGTYTTYWFNADAVTVGGDTVAGLQDAILETTHGDLQIRESVIVDWGAPDGFAVHAKIVGGTGKYEGATGWMVSHGNLEGDFLRYGGEICWPEE